MRKILVVFILFTNAVIAQNKPEVAFTIKEKDLIPEGMAYDPVDKSFYVGSVHKQKIVKIAESGVVTDFTRSGQDALLQVLGMKVEAATRRLWVCNNSPEHDTVNSISNIHVFDLKNGDVIKKYQLVESRKHLFNDLYITTSGDVYVTDSQAGGIYVIRKGGNTIDEFIKPGSLIYPNGITATPDETKLLVATGRATGIVSIDLQSRAITPLPDRRYLVIGVDGLYRHNNTLIGIQNTTFPESILYLYPTQDFTSLENIEFLTSHDPRYDSPTTGAIVADYFYFIANSQLLQIIGSKGKIKAPAKLQDVLIMRVKLK